MAGLDEGLRDLRIEKIPYSCHGPFDCVIELTESSSENLNRKIQTRATCFLRSESSGEFFVMTTFNSLLNPLIVKLVNETMDPASLPTHVANYEYHNTSLIRRLFSCEHNAEQRNESKKWYISQVNRLMEQPSRLKASVQKSPSQSFSSLSILSVHAGLYCQEIGSNGALLPHTTHEKCMNAVLLKIPNDLDSDCVKSLIHDGYGTTLFVIKEVKSFPQPPDENLVARQTDFFTVKGLKGNTVSGIWNLNSKKVIPKRPITLARGRCLVAHSNTESFTETYEGLAVYQIIPEDLLVGPATTDQSCNEQLIDEYKFTKDDSDWIRYGTGRVVAMYSEWSDGDALISHNIGPNELSDPKQTDIKKTHSTVLLVDIAIKEFQRILDCGLTLLSDVNPAGES